jgi:hypothetical protein
MKSTDLPLSKNEQRTCETFLAALPGTYKDIMAASGLSESAVLVWARRLHAQKVIHVSAMVSSRVQGKPCKVFALGAGEDAQVAAPHPEKGVRIRLAVRPMRVQESTVMHAMRVQPALARVWA